MKMEIKEKFTQFVKWSIGFFELCKHEPEKHGYFQTFKIMKINPQDEVQYRNSIQRKKLDLFNSELIPNIIRGNDEKISGNIYTYTLKRGFSVTINFGDLEESAEIQNYALNFLIHRDEFKKIISFLDANIPITNNKTNRRSDYDSHFRGLNYFIFQIILKNNRKELDDLLLEEYIIDYLEQISGKPSESLTINYIHGIHLYLPEVELLPNVKLKYYKKDDFEEIGRYGVFTYDYSLFQPLYIIKCRFNEDNKYKQLDFEKNIISCLQLYKTGSILTSHRLSFIKKMTDFHSLVFEENYKKWTQNVLNFFAYDIYPEEKEEIREFFSKVHHKLDFDKSNHFDQMISLSFERYQWALMEKIEIDRKMLFAIMGFEPLLKKRKEAKSIGEKIARRLAHILQYFNYKKEEVKNNIIEAYGYRSKITHGQYITHEDLEKMVRIFPAILDYLRMILVIYLVGFNSKGEFFSYLNKSIANKSKELDIKLTAIFQKYPNSFTKINPNRFLSKSLLDVKKLFEE